VEFYSKIPCTFHTCFLASFIFHEYYDKHQRIMRTRDPHSLQSLVFPRCTLHNDIERKIARPLSHFFYFIAHCRVLMPSVHKMNSLAFNVGTTPRYTILLS